MFCRSPVVLPFISILSHQKTLVSQTASIHSSQFQSFLYKHVCIGISIHVYRSLQLRAGVGWLFEGHRSKCTCVWSETNREQLKTKQRCCCIVNAEWGVIITIRDTVCSECTTCTSSISAKLRLATPERLAEWDVLATPNTLIIHFTEWFVMLVDCLKNTVVNRQTRQ